MLGPAVDEMVIYLQTTSTLTTAEPFNNETSVILIIYSSFFSISFFLRVQEMDLLTATRSRLENAPRICGTGGEISLCLRSVY